MKVNKSERKLAYIRLIFELKNHWINFRIKEHVYYLKLNVPLKHLHFCAI